jgi:hypothetical protein
LIGQLAAKKLPHEVDLVQITHTPGANDHVQLELQTLANTEWTIHGLGHQRNHVRAWFE